MYALRVALVGVVLAMTIGIGVPMSGVAEAQSGRKPPEKARKDQPPPPPPGQVDHPTVGTTPPPPQTPVTQKELQDAIQIGTSVVDVETVVYNKKTGVISRDLKQGSFEVYEDGVKQEITNFQPSEGPMTVVFVIEFSKRIHNRFIDKAEVLRPLYATINNFVQPNDNVAIVAFDTLPVVITDFTGDKKSLTAGLDLLIRNNPAFSESNLFDALGFTLRGGKAEAVNWKGSELERNVDFGGLKDVQTRSAVILCTIGIDTFSKLNYDETRKIVSETGSPIYCIGVGNLFYKIYDANLDAVTRMTWEQGFNTLKTFSRMSGGKYFPVTFPGEIPTTMQSIVNLMRSQYSIGYTPSNTRHEGKLRKIDVKVDTNGDGKIDKADEKDWVIQHRESYIEPLDSRK